MLRGTDTRKREKSRIPKVHLQDRRAIVNAQHDDIMGEGSISYTDGDKGQLKQEGGRRLDRDNSKKRINNQKIGVNIMDVCVYVSVCEKEIGGFQEVGATRRNSQEKWQQ